MIKFLLDQNLSPKTAEFLCSLGWEAKDLRELGKSGASDAEIYELAKAEGWILITWAQRSSSATQTGRADGGNCDGGAPAVSLAKGALRGNVIAGNGALSEEQKQAATGWAMSSGAGVPQERGGRRLSVVGLRLSACNLMT